MSTLFETETFTVTVPDEPFVDREEGGHLVILSKVKVRDRTKLTRDQAIEYTKLSMVVGEALAEGLATQGIEVGIVNYQEMGNWSVFKPEGPTLHMHIFGRAVTATKQKYGEAVLLPQRESGFYEGFQSLNSADRAAVTAAIFRLMATEKYQSF